MKVNLEKTFPMPVPADDAWQFLQDIEAVAACMPGAKITERVDDTHYKGTVTSRVGPATLSFNGTIEVLDVDPTAMTLRMYSDRKKWPLDGVTVKLNHQKIDAADCETCETKDGKLDQIDREIEIVGPLDDQQKQRLMQIADRCPVHRTLHSEIVVNSKLKS